MAQRKDIPDVLPWPQHLRDEVFDPARHCRVQFFGERASIARSLGRKVLPEIIAMFPPEPQDADVIPINGGKHV
jgi:hypothetical protein